MSKSLKSFAERVKEQAAKKAEQESKAASNPELAKLQEALRAKEIEVNRYKKQLLELEKSKAELEQFRELTTKEKRTAAIRDELSKTAKKLKVKDSALEDVLGLLEGKFQFTPEGSVVPTLPEGSEALDTETFVSQWLENKSHFIQPPSAQPAGVRPTPQGAKPTVTQAQGDVLSAASIKSLLGSSALYNKK